MSTGPGGTPDDGGMRVGDAERQSAQSALEVHVTAGRLTMTEFGTRSAKTAAARTRTELREVFDDLPAPHPAFGLSSGVGLAGYPGPADYAPAPPAGDRYPGRRDDRTRPQAALAALAASAGVLAVVLFFTTHIGWIVFLLIPLISSVGGALWGPEWRRRAPRR